MQINFAMEDELKCPVCHNLFVDPVILPCTHNLCCKCAETLKSKNGTVCDITTECFRRPDYDKVSIRSETVFSDADSGYSAGSLRSNSSDQGRTNSFSSISVNGNHLQQPSSPVATSPQNQGVHLPCLPESISCLTCPICQRTVFLDDRGVNGLTQNKLMFNIIKKFEHRSDDPAASLKMANGSSTWKFHKTEQIETANVNHNHVPHQYSPNENPETRVLACELCENHAVEPATLKCEQCQVLYCSTCQRRFHPARGSLASHTFTRLNQNITQSKTTRPLSAIVDKNLQLPTKKRSQSVPPNRSDKSNRKSSEIKLTECPFHAVENMSMYCEKCQVPLCYQCLEDGRHRSHDVKAIGATYKSHKEDLSQQMSALSNKARLAKDLVMHLRCVQEEIQENSVDFEARATAQCNALIEAINHKKQELIQRVIAEKEVKSKMVREQLQQCTMKLKQTTGLLEYCIEVMKDNDPAPFLQVSSGLIKRVSATEQQWTEHHLAPRTKSEFDFDLDATPLLQSIETFSVTYRRVPEKPIIKVTECASSNNTVTLSWGIHPSSSVDAFVLELDDGSRGHFRDVYHGKQTACTIDGLHFNSVYRARVSAYNRTGRSQCSDVVKLQTSEVATFVMDPNHSHPEIKYTNNYRTLNCTSTDNRVALANIGFSKGVHYWEYCVDRYESSNPDVVVGVAYSNVDKNCILGKDKNAWSMYTDAERTWFLHNDKHTNRCEGGIDVGSRLGVLLDLEKQTITYYVDQRQRGSSISIEEELVDLKTNRPKIRVFYPAISLNRQVQLTLWSGQRPPTHHRPALQHSQSFTGPTHSYKNKMMANHSISTNNGNHYQRSNEFSASPTSTMMRQKKSQSSGDLKSQQNSNQRLYHSLPSQPVVRMNNGPERQCSTLEKHPGIKEIEAEKPEVPERKPEKPAIKRKPPQLASGLQQARGRQLRQGSFKVPPAPPIRRGSSSSSINTSGSSTRSLDGEIRENTTLKTFQ